jgi:3-oxoacyl-[acyl-carrier protein] reductase
MEGSGHFSVEMNVSQEDSVQKAFSQVLEHFDGGIDGVVNNAGITKDQLLLRMKMDEFDSVVQTNLRGTFLCVKAALKPMLKARQGSIVNISSVVAQMGNPGQVNYVASKAGIEGLTRSAALEVASRGIRLNCVAPGFIVTDMTGALTADQRSAIESKIPLQRLGNVEDIAYLTAFLLSDMSTYITGQVLQVNGGLYL